MRPTSGSSPATRPKAAPATARDRFRSNDPYRAAREWRRYEGTPQRDLFRELRARFLARHSPSADRALDAGSGPGRFTLALGSSPAPRRVAMDIGREMLLELVDRRPPPRSGPAALDLVQGDAVQPPFAPATFGIVAALGNLLGFAGEEHDRLFESLVGLLTPGGTLLFEVAPGPGERSRYLRRLPPGSVARLFRSPPGAVEHRIAREGFLPEPNRRPTRGEFWRDDPVELRDRLVERGLAVREVVAVAPALGPDAARIKAVSRDPKAWGHLLEVEESLGRSPDRWPSAAAVLLAAERPATAERGSQPRGPKSEA